MVVDEFSHIEETKECFYRNMESSISDNLTMNMNKSQMGYRDSRSNN